MADIEIKNNTEEKGEGMTLLAYRMQKAEEAIKEGFRDQAAQIEKLTSGFVSKTTFEEAHIAGKEEHKNLQKQIDKIWSVISWTAKAIIGAIIVAAIAAVVAL